MQQQSSQGHTWEPTHQMGYTRHKSESKGRANETTVLGKRHAFGFFRLPIITMLDSHKVRCNTRGNLRCRSRHLSYLHGRNHISKQGRVLWCVETRNRERDKRHAT